MYTLVHDNRITKNLRSIPKTDLRLILNRLKSLETNPRGQNVIKLSGAENGYRLRIGNYCALFEINDKRKIVTIHHIRQRGNAYR